MTYRHFKGGEYELVGFALETTNSGCENTLVLYSKHFGDGTRMTYARAIGEFFEEVEWPDGQFRPRFCAVSKLEKQE